MKIIRFGVILALLTKLSVSQKQEDICHFLIDYFDVAHELNSAWISKIKTGERHVHSDVLTKAKSTDFKDYAMYLENTIAKEVSSNHQKVFINQILQILDENPECIEQLSRLIHLTQFNLLYCEVDFCVFLSGLVLLSLIFNPNNEAFSEKDYEFDDEIFSFKNKCLLPSTFTSTSDKWHFKHVFRKINTIEFKEGQKISLLSLYTLNLDYDCFDILSLENYIERRLGEYALSRVKLKNLQDDDRIRSINIIATNNIKKNNTKREAMGFLLYEFLENDLNAPKIFNGIEIGSKTEDLVHCDGVYLLNTGTEFQLVLGTSDIQNSIYVALNNTFSFAKELLSNRTKTRRFINSSILNKSFDSETANFLADIIIPKPESTVETNFSIGIFIGYSFNYDVEKTNSMGYEEAFYSQLEDDLNNLQPLVSELIKKHSLYGLNFYIYALPFNDAEQEDEHLRKVIRQEEIYE